VSLFVCDQDVIARLRNNFFHASIIKQPAEPRMKKYYLLVALIVGWGLPNLSGVSSGLAQEAGGTTNALANQKVMRLDECIDVALKNNHLRPESSLYFWLSA
jgi:hypothetical protein